MDSAKGIGMDARPRNANKDAWCKLGERAEVAFLGPVFASGCSVFSNPAKAELRYLFDAYFVSPCDLKTRRTRFHASDALYGIPSRSAFTINAKDVDRYAERWPLIVLVIDIDYGDYQTIRVAPLADIQRAIRHGLAKRHTYEQRSNDGSGNAVDSWVLDAEWFFELKR
jgi:hypothetical protein